MEGSTYEKIYFIFIEKIYDHFMNAWNYQQISPPACFKRNRVPLKLNQATKNTQELP